MVAPNRQVLAGSPVVEPGLKRVRDATRAGSQVTRLVESEPAKDSERPWCRPTRKMRARLGYAPGAPLRVRLVILVP